MSVLSSGLRRVLESACTGGRVAAESASRAALVSLAVTADRPPAHLSEEDRRLRRGLRAKARQLGDTGDSVELLVADCAYEQWHRLLFARFLAENNLLIHPDFDAPVTLADCDELAGELGEPDGWSVAARFASQILPGIFRLDDPCVQVRLAPEGRLALEEIVADLPSEVFAADDALGWVYQFWQKQKKDEVNASERKIGGADLGPVTQLFTENYMVRFLLENSLGAWWAARRPDSPLIKEWEYLRFGDDGAPAAGSFDGWPDTIDEVTVMDPCCGSGHFLVEAFKMLWRMRVEENGLDPVAAQDAVLRDNLFGLELDPRCVQIAMFAVALQAWKDGGGWRELPVPNIACSGIPVKAPLAEWKSLADGDPALEAVLEELHSTFRNADTLGSLIDPEQGASRAGRSHQTVSSEVDWSAATSLLQKLLAEERGDPAPAVLGADAAGLSSAAALLAQKYELVVTNVPFLARGRHGDPLLRYGERALSGASADLATLMLDRTYGLCRESGGLATVSPQNWTTAMPAFEDFRRAFGRRQSLKMLARLGAGAFSSISGEVVQPCLLVSERLKPTDKTAVRLLDSSGRGAENHATWIATAAFEDFEQLDALRKPGAALAPDIWKEAAPLGDAATAYAGAQTGDDGRFRRHFWELPRLDGWQRYQTSSNDGEPYGGRNSIVRLNGPDGASSAPGSVVRGTNAWSRSGIAVARSSLQASIYSGYPFNDSITVVVPKGDCLGELWSFLSSPALEPAVRALSKQVKVGNKIFEKIPFDPKEWTAGGVELPPLQTSDPAQWDAVGEPAESLHPLQVAVARLLGYSWPANTGQDRLSELVDADGIVCIPSVLGERAATDRVDAILACSYGPAWTATRGQDMVRAAGSKKGDLEAWLRNEFFADHCKLFENRPFIWHIWDGHKDGFAAFVNYHRLDHASLERLTYTYLGDWIERQTAGVRDDVAGAEDRFAAAKELQRKLELVLVGEPPYDIFVRWKGLHEQPIGWNPDLNDGVRLNIRPFVEADVLRKIPRVRWTKDGGKNPDGSERHNDLHYTNAEKLTARKEAGV